MSGEPTHSHTLDEVLPARAKEAFRHLELYARRAVDGLRHGVHRSRRLGVSTDFAHHKDYAPGDPLRHIDWKASARHDRFFTKRYQEDRSLTLYLVVDRSASMGQATDGLSKYWHACRLAASLAYLVIKKQDAAGLALASAGRTRWLPPSSRPTHLVGILRALIAAAPEAPDAAAACLADMVERGARRGVVGLITDLMFDPRPVQRELGRLQAQGHEAILFQVRDPAEEDFPFNRWVQFGDLENASVRHRIDAVTLKRIYHEEYRALNDEWQAWTKKNGVHFISLRTDEHVDRVLSDYVAYRMRTA